MGNRDAVDLLDEASEALIAMSPDGIVRLWNRAAAQMFDLAADEAIGRPIDEALPLSQEGVGARQLIAEAVARGGVTQAGIQAADGSLVELRMSVVSDARGDIDMIAARARRSQIEGSGPAFRGLLEAAPDAMVIADAAGRILALNAHTVRLFGYTRDELLGRLVEVLVPERARDLHAAHRASYVRDFRTRPMAAGLELRCRRKDGTVFPGRDQSLAASWTGGDDRLQRHPRHQRPGSHRDIGRAGQPLLARTSMINLVDNAWAMGTARP